MKVSADELDDITDSAAVKMLETLLESLNGTEWDEADPSLVREVLGVLILGLDNLDADDPFGTEGWRHDLLGED